MLEWKKEYNLGIEEIDNQHKHLFEIAARVGELTKDIGEGIDCYDDFMNILNELVDYTIYHFDYEEAYMQKNNFNNDEFLVHQVEHKMFVKKLEKFQETDFDENQYESINNMLTFLVDWIVHHIIDVDSKYVKVS
ncbi:bacteriohemerythrin [Vallitalea guaymasensis]|uniref:bacteriohemerythrin n=1 Tax=Vallitalea guaymasensis TaxID=1185412 RepID=UPI00272D5360|nr:bacteriohemerythrin [Vallitalea guaymasensis]